MIKKVGYKSPPNHTKWQKGRSGNPSGRKKGQRNLKTDLAEEMANRIEVNEGGKARKLTKQQLMIKALIALAIKGDVRAAALVLNFTERWLGEDDTPTAAPPISAEDEALVARFLERNAKKVAKP